MKKILSFALSLMFLFILCACEETIIENPVGDVEDAPNVITQYKGKDDYEDVFLGSKSLVVDDKYYYYVDWESGFCRIDKTSGESAHIYDAGIMNVYKNYIYFENEEEYEVVIFDTITQKLEKKSFKSALFPLELHDYSFETTMVESGWIIIVYDSGSIYKSYSTDRNFGNKKEIYLPSKIGFVLDNEAFYLVGDHKVYCCDIEKNQTHYLWEPEGDIFSAEECFSPYYSYLGKDKILVAEEEELKIVNLKDGETFLSLNDDYVISTIYDDEYIYLLEDTESGSELSRVSYKSKKRENLKEIFTKYNVFECELSYADDEYLYIYLCEITDGTQESAAKYINSYYRIKKDGSGLERII